MASFPWCCMGYLAAVLSLERGPSKCCRPGGQAGFSTCPQSPHLSTTVKERRRAAPRCLFQSPWIPPPVAPLPHLPAQSTTQQSRNHHHLNHKRGKAWGCPTRDRSSDLSEPLRGSWSSAWSECWTETFKARSQNKSFLSHIIMLRRHVAERKDD